MDGANGLAAGTLVSEILPNNTVCGNTLWLTDVDVGFRVNSLAVKLEASVGDESEVAVWAVEMDDDS